MTSTKSTLRVCTTLTDLTVHSLPFELVVLNDGGTIVHSNAAWQNGLFQLNNHSHTQNNAVDPLKEINPINYFEFLHQITSLELSKIAEIKLCFDNVSVQKSTHATSDISLLIETHIERWYRVNVFPIHSESSRDIDAIVITHEDISDQKKMEHDLITALAQIRTLHGLIPICSVCKYIRDENSCWIDMESYIDKRTHAKFTHDICTSCMKKLYPHYSSNLKIHEGCTNQ